jgi:hypothetical protein
VTPAVLLVWEIVGVIWYLWLDESRDETFPRPFMMACCFSHAFRFDVFYSTQLL